jgi:transposase
MRFVSVKSVEQQDIQAVHRVRAELSNQRKAKGNQIRGLVAEYGLLAPRGLMQLRAAVPAVVPHSQRTDGSACKRGGVHIRPLEVAPRTRSAAIYE